MTKSDAIVNRIDKDRLERYLASAAPNGPAYQLRRLLDSARAVRPDRVPPDVVTMNSQIAVRDPRDDAVDSYILAYPDHEDPDGFAISVLSPLGAALLAAREGESVTLMGARGARSVLVQSIAYQPERAGDHDL